MLYVYLITRIAKCAFEKNHKEAKQNNRIIDIWVLVFFSHNVLFIFIMCYYLLAEGWVGSIHFYLFFPRHNKNFMKKGNLSSLLIKITKPNKLA